MHRRRCRFVRPSTWREIGYLLHCPERPHNIHPIMYRATTPIQRKPFVFDYMTIWFSKCSPLRFFVRSFVLSFVRRRSLLFSPFGAVRRFLPSFLFLFFGPRLCRRRRLPPSLPLALSLAHTPPSSYRVLHCALAFRVASVDILKSVIHS